MTRPSLLLISEPAPEETLTIRVRPERVSDAWTRQLSLARTEERSAGGSERWLAQDA